MTTLAERSADESSPVGDDRPWYPRPTDIADRLAASDPGLNRLRLAVITLSTIGAALGVEYAFVHVTGALLLSAPAGAPASVMAQVAAQHHGIIVIAMLMGAIMGMLSGFGVNDPTVGGQLRTLALMPFPVIGTTFAGLALSKHRIASLVLITVALGVGVYLRRFGPRGFICGMLLFMGSFLGYFIGAEVTVGQGVWLACFLLVGLAVSALLRLTLFRPRPRVVLDRTMRSFRGRARQVVARSLEVLDAGEGAALERSARVLRRRLVRLNEAALMIDAQMVDPASLPDGADAHALHEALFDLELGYQNLGRRVEILVRLGVPEPVRSPLRATLVALGTGQYDQAELHARVLLDTLQSHPDLEDQPAAFAHRVAVTVLTILEDIRTWGDVVGPVDGSVDRASYRSPVVLMMGNLAGSALVSQAVAQPEQGPWRGLSPNVRAAVQIMVATGLAITLGDQLSGRRYYWAVIAVMVTSMGTNTAGEKVTKAGNRVVGTVIGILVGSLLVHAVGTSTVWSLVVILGALFFGLYLMRVSYVFMTIGITTMISQLYLQLDEFTNSLLVLRLEETAIGAAVGLVAALVVFPVSTRRAAGRATGNYLDTLADVVRGAARIFGARSGHEELRAELRTTARGLDDNLQQLLFTLRPLRRNPFGRDRLRDNVSRFDATAHQARNLAVDAAVEGPADPSARDGLGRVGERVADAISTMARFAEGDRTLTYHRSSAALDRVDRSLERSGVALLRGDRLGIHHLNRIDTMMAELARQMGMPTVDDSEEDRPDADAGTPASEALAVAAPAALAGKGSSAAAGGPDGGRPDPLPRTEVRGPADLPEPDGEAADRRDGPEVIDGVGPAGEAGPTCDPTTLPSKAPATADAGCGPYAAAPPPAQAAADLQQPEDRVTELTVELRVRWHRE